MWRGCRHHGARESRGLFRQRAARSPQAHVGRTAATWTGRRDPYARQSLASDDAWVPPTWDRPSEGTVPAALAVDALVLQNDVVAVAIDRLEVYPNGFTISVLMRVDPRRVREMMEMLRPLGAHRWPSVGVRFADGRTAGCAAGTGAMHDLAKDEHGVPVEPFMSIGSRGGAPDGWHAWAWVFPLPPDGPLEISVALEAAGVGESSVTIDGTAVVPRPSGQGSSGPETGGPRGTPGHAEPAGFPEHRSDHDLPPGVSNRS